MDLAPEPGVLGPGIFTDDNDELGKRRRIARACEQCRKKKIKCDGKVVCGNCIAYKTECIFTESLKKRATPRGAKYIASLENRLQRMEQLLERDKHSSNDVRSTPSDPQDRTDEGPLLSPCGHAVGPQGWKCEQCGSHPAEVPKDVTDDLTDQMGYLFLHATGESEYMGASGPGAIIDAAQAQIKQVVGDTSFQDFCREAHMTYASNMLTQDAALLSAFGSWKPERPTLPPRDLCNHYIEAYFSQVHHVFPILDKDEFLREAKDLYDRKDNDDPNALCMYLMVLAYGSHVFESQHHGQITSTGYKLFTSAAGMVYSMTHAVSLRALQGMMMVALYMENNSHSNHLWSLLGFIVRKAQTLGLHRDLTVVQPTTRDRNGVVKHETAHKQMESRRRTFWMLYVMDNDLASSMGRPVAIQDFDCDQAYPSTSNDALQDTVGLRFVDGTHFSYLHAQIQLSRISHQVQQRLFSVRSFALPPEQVRSILADLDKKLIDWLDNIPDEFHPDKSAASLSHGPVLPPIYHTHLIPLLQLRYHHLMITVHRRNLASWKIPVPQSTGESHGSRMRASASHAIAVHAARCSLAVIASSPPREGDACIQLKNLYPTVAAFVLFANLMHNPGSLSAGEDLRTLQALIRDIEAAQISRDRNVLLQLEVFKEIARIAEAALANSSAQGIKRGRSEPQVDPVYPPYQGIPRPMVEGISGSAYPAAAHQDMPGLPNLMWQNPAEVFSSSHGYSVEESYPIMVPVNGYGNSDPLPTTYGSTFVDRRGGPVVEEVHVNNYNKQFEESLWQMSGLPGPYG